MESFLTTLPPFVHQYINKYPPTECFNVLKELVCFAVLYSNDREHMNLLSLELLQKGADRILVHHPYVSSTLNTSSMTSKQILRQSPTPMDSVAHQLSPTTTIAPGSKANHSPSLKISNTTTQRNTNKHQHTKIHLDHGCQPILKQDAAKIDIIPPQATDTTKVEKPVKGNNNPTLPSVFPDWWAHPDTETKDTNVKTTTQPSNPAVANERPSAMTRTQEMNITNWIPINFENTTKSTRPTSVHNPTIPDLRSYPDPIKKSQQVKDTTKESRRMSAPLCDSPTDTNRKNLTRSATTTVDPQSFRPGQTATVRARAEAARQRQIQLDLEKQKQQAAARPSRTHLRLKQQAVTSMDWDAIKKGRRQTMPATH